MSGARLEGMVAWISGGASGMGAATARLFVQEGARVAIADVNGAQARQVADVLNQSGEIKALAVTCDVSSEADVQRSIEQAVDQFGDLHILVNNAGVSEFLQLHDCEESEWDRVMDVNVKAAYLSFKVGYPHMRKHDRSYVVNVASISSFVGQAGTPVYTASKHALLGLTRSIALDYAVDGIRCNCVCPGITDTPMLRNHLNQYPDGDELLANRLRRVPLGVALTPDDIARAVLYLSCEDSAKITGTSVVIDGGSLAAAEWESK